MQLIHDYMNREDTTVPDGTPIQVHGCGEFFPLSASGEKVDQSTPDGKHIQQDRRVEVFLFPSEVGVLPPVPGEKASSRGEKEYPEWRFRAIDFELLGFSMILWIDDDSLAQVTDGDAPPGSEDHGPENADAV